MVGPGGAPAALPAWQPAFVLAASWPGAAERLPGPKPVQRWEAGFFQRALDKCVRRVYYLAI